MTILKQIRDLTGRWFSRRSLDKKGNKRLRHLISTWARDEERDSITAIAFCGVHLKDPVAADAIGPWNPEDHLDCVCPDCLRWYRDMKPKAVNGKIQN